MSDEGDNYGCDPAAADATPMSDSRRIHVGLTSHSRRTHELF
ncbi:hypothetical protein [Halorubrum vacuolatum]|nr:hypothetical protein [Halorubrum vacuolatum]